MSIPAFGCVACKTVYYGVAFCPRCLANAKVSVCRSNTCGHYDADSDSCTILTKRGKRGVVTYILTHPLTRCVDERDHFIDTQQVSTGHADQPATNPADSPRCCR